jgi:hypothetical protein
MSREMEAASITIEANKIDKQLYYGSAGARARWRIHHDAVQLFNLPPPALDPVAVPVVALGSSPVIRL